MRKQGRIGFEDGSGNAAEIVVLTGVKCQMSNIE